MRIFFVFLSLLFISAACFGQQWDFVNDTDVKHLSFLDKEASPTDYSTIKLNLSDLENKLKEAPHESLRDGSTIIELPMPEGHLERFEIVNSPVMMRGLAEKYPHIQSFRAHSLDNPAHNARLTYGNHGLYAAIRSTKGEIYIDPYGIGEKEYYMSYYIASDNGGQLFTDAACGTLNAFPASAEEMERERDVQATMRDPADNINFRTYRMAISCTGEWGGFQGSVADALETVVATINRANLIYENELSINFILVNDNDLLLYTDGATDPYDTPQTGAQLIPVNTNIINAAIGSSSYDIGHIFARCTDVGGIAFLRSICADNKAGGATCYYGTSPTNGLIGTFTHEMGHQMGANHTMNNCSNGGAGGNENSATGYEVGSGSTLMSYSGACGSDNTGKNYQRYHVSSIEEMYNITRNGANGDCGVKTDIDNHAPEPVLDYENGFYIPIETPFVLSGEATDCDGDELSYSWEQFDIGPLSNVGSPIGNAPIFETYPLTEDKTRYFPRALTVLTNGYDQFELMPTYSRDLTFRFVVRDNNPGGGTIEWAEVEFQATEEAGPFMVTYPTAPETFEVGQEIEVEWDVANTDGDLVDCQRVDIYLSIDGGFNWGDIVLAENVPNDGKQTVILPNTPADFIRVIVKGHDNVFYDMGNIDSELVVPTTPGFAVDVSPLFLDLCLPATSSLSIESAAFAGFSENVVYEVVGGLPPGAIATFSNNNVSPDEDIMLDLDMSSVTVTGEYIVQILATAGTETRLREVVVNVTGTDFSPLATVGPEENAMGVTSLPSFSWTDVPDATLYDFQLASSPSFSTETIIKEVTGISNTYYVLTDLLEKNSIYYWRVRAFNKCAEGDYIATKAFGTETLNCNVGAASNLPLEISGSGTHTVEATIPVTSTGDVVDVVIKRIQGVHDKVSDLAGILISPDGTEIILWEERCGNSSNFNLGFNDAAAGPVSCPINTGNTFQPVTPLSTLAGEGSQGIWKLRLEDRDPGNGGRLNELDLEICSNTSLDPPVLVNNNVLQLPPNAGQKIFSENLLTQDPDNTDEELVYTVVNTPAEGELFLGGATLSIGDQFTQLNINNSQVRYRHADTSMSTVDAFTFTVQDGNGGWVGITQFDIEIDPSHISAVEDIDEVDFIQIYPNPTKDQLMVNLVDYQGSDMTLTIYNVDGKKMLTNQLASTGNSVTLKDYSSGLYIVELTNGIKRYQKRILKID